MIEQVWIRTASALWRINEVEIVLRHRKTISVEEVRHQIVGFQEILCNRSYEKDNTELCKAFLFFGGIAFISVGAQAFSQDFLRMFRFYTKIFVENWANENKMIRSKYVGYEYVFQVMLSHSEIKINYDYRYILDDSGMNKEFSDVVEQEFSLFWVERIKEAMIKRISLMEIVARLGIIKTAAYASMCEEDLVEAYLKHIAEAFTLRRERISLAKVNSYIYGKDRTESKIKKMSFDIKMRELVDKEFKIQYVKFPDENQKQLDVKNDIWVIYQQHGPGLRYNQMDFTLIESQSMRQEVKYYFKHQMNLRTRVNNRSLSQIAYVVNLLVKNNPKLHYFADIDEVDVRTLQMILENLEFTPNGRKKSVINTMVLFGYCRAILAYLMGEWRDETIKSPRPHQNYFASYTFVNSSSYVKNTSIIPEDIMEQIEQHQEELSKEYQVLYQIFSNTGMRAKEVVFLEEDCLEESRYAGIYELKYKPYKVLSARRRNHLSDYQRILIPKEVAELIQQQIKGSLELRKTYGLPYIFIKKRDHFKASMANPDYFAIKLDELARKYDMRDENGEIWHFTSRQYRKTLAVTLIENGGSIEEVAYWLGHLSHSTAKKYYADVRKRKLAEMNHQFFKEKFGLLLSGEQLAVFSEEERRLLYIDFCLEQRRVEFGYCLKKLADGVCDQRNHLYNCVNCKNLCTGRKYLEYWKEMLEQQEEIVDRLIKIYEEKQITGFNEFREYKQEMFLLTCYENMIQAIEGGGCHE